MTASAGANQVTISWTAANGNGHALTANVVREISGGNVGQSSAVKGKGTSLVTTGLAGGVAATFSVVAENSCGAGPATDSPQVTPTGNGNTYAATVIADAPSVYYRMAEASGPVMADSSGNGQDGQYDPLTVLGKPGALLSDPGATSVNDPGSSSDGVGTSPASSLPQFADPRTVTAWVNTTAASDNPLVVAWGSAGTDQSFIVGIEQSAITVDGGNDYRVIPTSHPVGDGNWHFIAVTFDGSVISAYLDGQLQGTARFRSTLATFGSALGLGYSNNYAYNQFVGQMQDVAVYPAVLSAGAISAQYAVSGYALPAAPPAAHAAPAGPNGAQITWGDIVNLAEPTLSYVVTVTSGPAAGESVSAPGDATAVKLSGLAAGAARFTVTATNDSGAGPPATTNSYTVPGAAATYASTVESDVPAVFYRLGDGTSSVMTDSSGSGATGSYDSDVTLNAPGPLVGDTTTAATVGTSEAVGTAAGALPLYNSRRTAEAWFNTTAPDDVAGYQYQSLLAWGGDGTDQGFTVGETPNAIWVDGTNDAHSFATPYPVNDGNWHFVAVTYDGTTVTVYLDGAEIGTGQFGQRLNTVPPGYSVGAPPVGLYLGEGVSTNGFPVAPLYQGSLADVAVFPASLSSTQISAQFAASGHARPTAPGSVTATAGANQATVTWSPSTAPGSTVTNYLVTALKGGTQPVNAVAVPGTANSATVTGLQGGGSYGFDVQAEDSYGPSPTGATTSTVSPTGAAKTYVSTVLGDAPVLYYRLGDSTDAVMADSSGNDANGIYNASAVTLGQPGAVIGDADTAAQITDGTQGIGSASVSLPLANTARSIVAWMKESSTDNSQDSLVSWGQQGTEQAFQLIVTGAQQVAVDGGNDTHTFTTPYPIDDGSWHQFAVTYTGAAFSVYFDGSVIGTGAFNAPLDTLASPLYLGGGPLDFGPTGATLDEISVYPSALSSAQIAAQFTAAGYSRPAAPTGLSALAGANQATVSWTGSSSVKAYLVTALTGGQPENSVAVGGSATSAVIGGLAAGVSYTFQVTATNTYGAGTPATTGPVTPTGTPGTYSTAVLADNPTAYYRLADSTTSVMTDSSAGQANGSYVPGNVTLKATGAIQGDPSTGITLQNGATAGQGPANLPLYNSARTMEAWFKIPAGTTPSGTLLGWGQTGADQAFDCDISASAITVDASSETLPFTTPYAVNDGHWHQLAVSYDGTTATVYLDGQAIGSSQFNNPLDTLPSPLYLGSDPGGFNGPGGGVALDQVSVYPAALTAARVAAQFAVSGNGPPSVPGSVTAQAGSNQATVGWTAAAALGAPVTSYLVTAYAGSTAEYAKAVGGKATSAVITGLPAGTSYTFQVVARNAYGAGPAGTSPAVTPTGNASTYASTVLGDNPSAYYRLGDSTTALMADSSGHGGTGSYDASFVTLGVTGAIKSDSDTAVKATGGQVGTAAPTLPDEKHARTVTAWVKSADISEQFVAGWGNTLGSAGFSVGFDSKDIYVDEYGNVLDFKTTTGITNGTWHLITVTATGTSATAYLDGTAVATKAFPVTLDTAPGQPLIVGAGVGGDPGIDGSLDELAIFPSALPAASITALYNAGISATGIRAPRTGPPGHPNPATSASRPGKHPRRNRGH